MRKLSVLLFLIAVMCSHPALAQTPWKKYKSGKFKFQVEFPSEFQIEQGSAVDNMPFLEAHSELETMLFAVSVQKSPVPITFVNSTYLATQAMQEFVASLEAEVLKEYMIKNKEIEGVGVDLLINSGGNTATVRAFAGNGNIYFIYSIALHPSADYSISKRFFDSFKIR